MIRKQEATGKTVDEARAKACALLGVQADDLNVSCEVLEMPQKTGFLGLKLTPAKVCVSVEEPDAPAAPAVEEKKAPVQEKAAPAPAVEAPAAPAEPEAKAEEPAAPAVEAAPAVTDAAPAADAAERPAPVQRKRSDRPKKDKPRQPKAEGESAPKPERKPLPPKAPAAPLEKPVVTMIPDEQIDPASPVGQAQSFLKELTHLMGVDVTVAMGTDAENNIFAQMTGDTLGILIGRRGETLDALQYLTSLRINKGQDHYTRVTLDTENYRAKREDTLIRLANRMANRAVKTGRKVSLEPMNPYERRVIHSALQPNELVDTHSEGEEPKRHIVITLRK